MIKLLEIENFKSLKKESFDFGKLNIITGVNSAGKSSVIQTLLLLADALSECNSLDDKMREDMRRRIDKESSILQMYLNKLVKFDAKNISESQLKEKLAQQLKRIDLIKQTIDEYKKTPNMLSIPNLKNWSFKIFRNRRENAKNIKIKLDNVICTIDPDSVRLDNFNIGFKKDVDFFYLSENRSGPENKELFVESDEFGDRAEYVMGNFYRHQQDPIDDALVVMDNMTLSGNVDYWMSKILKSDEKEFSIGLKVEKIDSASVKSSYDFCGLPGIEPLQLGAGVSYLAKMLIVCLRAKPGQVVIIENPEMLLHPRAQSAVGHFLSFIASKGIQVVIETHCEHLINKVQYDVLKGILKPEDVFIYYKKSSVDNFEKMTIGQDGHFYKNEERCFFPEGFFDATLEELMEIG